MKNIVNKIIILTLILSLTVLPVFSKNSEDLQMVTTINHKFTMSDISNEVHIMTSKDIKVSEDIIIPKNSTLTIQTIQAQKERRWHKGGFIIGKLKSYTIHDIDKTEMYNNYEHELYEADLHDDFLLEYEMAQTEFIPIKEENTVDISDKNIYVQVYKYEPVNKKEAVILATEIIVTSGASFFAPGVDVGYFFLKGAIMRKKHPNWFRAGVMNAYENSIFWFWLKGKPIELHQDTQISIKSIEEEDVMELKEQIEARNDKNELKELKKQVKLTEKEIKKFIKQEEIAQKENLKFEKEYAEFFFDEYDENYDNNVEIFQEFYLDGTFVQ